MSPKLRVQLVTVMLLRIILNTMHRMVYPFLSIFATGLGVDVTAISLALAGRNFAGIFGPFLAPLANRRGRRFGLLAGITAFTVGVGLVAVHPSLFTLSAALILAMLSKSLFDPTIQAYFGDRVVYEQRGTALAITEISWSVAFILGVPAAGYLIARFGWSSPFPVLAVLGLVMFAVIWWMIPGDDSPDGMEGPDQQRTGDSRKNLQLILASVPALAGMSIGLWASAANEMVNLVFGVWLANSFGLQIAALAGASVVIGLSELSGEGLVALTTDRLGKPRALAIGLTGNIIASLLLPFIGRTETGALIGLFLFYISFEYTVVSQIPLMTESVPRARATVMALNLVGYGIGRSLGSLLSTFIYLRLGFLSVTLIATLFNLFALVGLAEVQKKIILLPHFMAWLKRTFQAG
jgi:MFS transporter, DHA1 family, inner membrane transport protein